MSPGTRLGAAAPWLVPALAVWLLNVVWLSRDSRPPVWDMAMHQSHALNYAEGALDPETPWWRLSGNYPPFVHLAIASCFAVAHAGPRIAALSNFPATLLLFWAIHDLASALASRRAARWAVTLAAFTPYLLWMSRETILDYWLSAWVACSLALLLRSGEFESRRWSLASGAALGFGLLTKWLFAGYIALPYLLLAVRGRVWRDHRRAVHAVEALTVAGTIASIWYLPNVPELLRYFGENARIGAREGEPPILSLQSFVYYLRLLEGYQLFAVLFLVTVAGCWYSWRRKLFADPPFLWTAILGGWLAMTLLRTKDPRFTMPLLGLLTIPAGSWVASWGAGRMAVLARCGLVALLAVQAYMINFGISALPREVVLVRGYQGSLRWDWNLYLQEYFGILGPPRRENWRQEEILRRLERHAQSGQYRRSLALVPDLPRFNAANFLLFSRLLGMRVEVDHIQAEPRGVPTFDGFDFVVMVEGGQGMSWTTGNSGRLNQIVVDEPGVFRLLGLYPLPNGDTARLYFVQREGGSTE